MAVKCHEHYNYNKKLQPLARQLRRSLAKSEACLWHYALKEKQLKGYQFRRQRPILQYIADFFCKELKLIIEIDGITHDNKVSRSKDLQREACLTKAGFKIVRFTDDEVLENMDGVISRLEIIIGEIEALPRRLSDTPSKGGQERSRRVNKTRSQHQTF